MPECFYRASSALTGKRCRRELWIPAKAGMTLLRSVAKQSGICYRGNMLRRSALKWWLIATTAVAISVVALCSLLFILWMTDDAKSAALNSTEQLLRVAASHPDGPWPIDDIPSKFVDRRVLLDASSARCSEELKPIRYRSYLQ